jgi:hypothetical protein
LPVEKLPGQFDKMLEVDLWLATNPNFISNGDL